MSACVHPARLAEAMKVRHLAMEFTAAGAEAEAARRLRAARLSVSSRKIP